MISSPFGKKQDIYFMTKAVEQARLAHAAQEVPIGALLVNENGVVVAKGYNTTESGSTQADHAEMKVLRKAGDNNSDWRLDGHWLYVTLEPCAMCMHMIMLSRLDGIIWGASSPLFGHHLDNPNLFRVYKKDVVCIPGVCATESEDILKSFFKERREHGRSKNRQKSEEG